MCGSTDSGAVTVMRSDSDGNIRVDGIQWGGYYFEETKAPEGFSVGEKVRFTVNRESCQSVQQLECVDMAAMRLIQIDKNIDNKTEEFGTPSFLFKISKTDEPKTDYTRIITLSGSELSGSALVQVPTGAYRVEELKSNRYVLTNTEFVFTDDPEDITTTAENRNIQGGKVFTFTLSSDGAEPRTAHLLFENTLDNYSGLSHSTAVNNIIPSVRKITGIIAPDGAAETGHSDNGYARITFIE